MKLRYPIFVYDNESMIGNADRAPAGMPCEIVKSTTHGRGKQRITRHLIRTTAPEGWGQWSGRAFYGWIDPEYLEGQS